MQISSNKLGPAHGKNDVWNGSKILRTFTERGRCWKYSWDYKLFILFVLHENLYCFEHCRASRVVDLEAPNLCRYWLWFHDQLVCSRAGGLFLVFRMPERGKGYYLLRQLIFAIFGKSHKLVAAVISSREIYRLPAKFPKNHRSWQFSVLQVDNHSHDRFQ